MKILCLPDLQSSSGGPATFQKNLLDFLSANRVSHSFTHHNPVDIVFLINGSRKIFLLFSLWLRGVPIILRLGSIYRSDIFERPGIKGDLAYLPKFALVLFSALLSRYIIYQSHSVKKEWACIPFLKTKYSSIIYNPAPSTPFSLPLPASQSFSSSSICLISVEANHASPALSYPYLLFNYLVGIGIDVRLDLVGALPSSWEASNILSNPNIYSHGYLDSASIHKLVGRLSKPIYIPSDIFPCGCPNSMIEILALGVPSISYDGTPGCELIRLCDGGLVMRSLPQKLPFIVHRPFDEALALISKLLDNYAFFSSNALSISSILNSDSIFLSYLDLFRTASLSS